MKTDLDFLIKLLKIPSVSANTEEVNKALDCMQAYLEEHGVLCRMENMDGHKVLYASTMAGKEQDWLLNAHMDVVPADTAAFEPRIEGDLIYGRGTNDCKGCCLAIAQTLIALVGKASVGAIFTDDEEIGGNTTRYMVEKGYAARKLVIVVDSSAYSIVTAEKGMVNFTLRAKGKAAHSSRPWDGENAIDNLIDGYLKLRKAWGKNAPAEDGDNWFDTMAADIITGGEIFNKVPDSAEMVINVRFTKPGDEKRICNFIKETTGLEVTHDEVSMPVFCDEKETVLQKLQAAMQRKWNDKEIPFVKISGATDARHFAINKAPIAIIGIEGENCHTENEWASIKSISDTAEMLIDFINS